MELLLIPTLVVSVFVLVLWALYFKEPHETVAIFHDPPEGLSVIECGILIDDVLSTREVVFELYNLYLQGYIIQKDNDKYAINVDIDNKKIEELNDTQRYLLDLIFDHSGEFFTSKEAYRKSFDNIIEDGKHKITQVDFDLLHNYYLSRISRKVNDLKLISYETLAQKGYFKKSPFEQRKPFITIGSLLIAAPLLWNIFQVIDGEFESFIPWNGVLGLALAGFILAYSSLFFVKKTQKGFKAKAKILGFAQYIETAEKDRIQFVLKNNIKAYNKTLPYAALFNELEKWIEPVKKIQETTSFDKYNFFGDNFSDIGMDVGIAEQQKWLKLLSDLFWYGAKTIGQIFKNNKIE